MAIDFSRIIWAIIKKIIYVTVLLTGIFAAYFAYMTWEVSEIKEICKSAVPGTPISEMQKLIQSNGGHLFRSFDVPDKQGIKAEIICATTTMCEAKCTIYHNSTHVLETKL